MSRSYTGRCRLLILVLATALLLDATSAHAQWSVDEARGTVGYRIPLLTPPGTAGHGPELALAYTSAEPAGPAGWLGLGWTLAGESRIERALRHGVPYDWDDRSCGSAADRPCYRSDFVLDGQDLICDEPSCAACSAQQPCRYRTQSDDGRLIRFLGENGGWEIRDREGRVLQYGPQAATTIVNPNNLQVFAWLLARSEDVHGNWIEHAYDHTASPGVAYLARIDWAQSGAASNRHVEFVLNDPLQDPRTDAPIRQLAGFRQQTGRRLSEIRVRAGGAPVQSYELVYEQDPDSGRSQLQSVQRVGSDGQTRLLAHRFEYSRAARGFSAAPDFGSTACMLQNPVLDDGQGTRLSDLLDMNRDGFPDLYWSAPYSGAAEVRVSPGTGDGWLGEGPGCYQGELWAGEDLELLGASPQFVDRAVLDLDADGYSDHLKTFPTQLRLGSAEGFAAPIGWSIAEPSEAWFRPGFTPWGINVVHAGITSFSTLSRLTDMTGDGRPDLVMTLGLQPYSGYQFDRDGALGGECPEVPSECDPDWAAFSGWAVFPNRGLQQDAAGAWRLDFPAEPLAWTGPGLLDHLLEHVHALFYTDRALVDVNGDGLPDRLSQDTVQYNHGAGFDPPEPIGPLPELRVNAGCSYVDLLDLNGDGFVDHVSALAWTAATPEWRVRFGTGSGFASDAVAFATPSAGFRCIDGTPGGAFDYPVATRDLDGDGLLDHITGTLGGAPEQVSVHAGPRSGLLVRAITPFGGEVTFEYDSALRERDADGSAANPELWMALPVLKRLAVSDGRVGTPDIVTEFAWAEGRFDAQEREFRGFGRVTRRELENGLVGSVSETRFHTDRACAFQPSSDELRRDGALFAASTQVHSAWAFGGPEPAEQWTRCLLVERLDSAVEGDLPNARTRRTTWDYGDDPRASFFNPQRVEEQGEWSAASGDVAGDERITELSYALHAHEPPYIVERISELRVSDAQGVTHGWRRAYYDGRALHETTAGLPTRIEEWLSDPWSLPALPERFVATAVLDYDAFGNVVLQTGAPTEDDPDGLAVATSFDPSFQTFVVSRRTGADLPQPLEHGFDYEACAAGKPAPPGLGLVCRTSDPSGLQDTLGYDALGRLVSVESHRGSVEIHGFEPPDPEGPAEGQLTRSLQLASGEQLHWVRHVDGLERVFREESPGTLAETIQIERSFDSRGRIASESLPFVSGSPLLRSFGYDALGRVALVSEPDGTTSRVRSYQPWRRIDETFFASDRQQRTERSFDGLGRLVEVADFEDAASLGSAPFRIRARYDARDRLLEVSDPIANDPTLCEAYAMDPQCSTQEHVTRLYWDTLGRRVRMEDPDAGTWRFRYDDSGLLSSRSDGSGRQQGFVYDPLQRPIARSFLPVGNGTSDASYEYGETPGAPSFGRLVRVASETSYEYGYDASGRLAEVTQTTSGRSFRDTRVFDSLDRVVERRFPDDELFRYVHDGLRLVEIVGDESNAAWPNEVLRNAEYDPAGRIRHLELGRAEHSAAASATLDYSYDGATGRLERILGVPAQAAPDADGDRIPDAADNCPYAFNPQQPDSGSVVLYPSASGSPPDGFGDECQCGDVSGDGEVEFWSDAVAYLLWLYEPGSTLAHPERCNTDASPTCDDRDLYRSGRATLGVGEWPAQSCLPATPANLPWSGAIDLLLEFDGLGRLTGLGGSLGGPALAREYTYDGLGRLIETRAPWAEFPGRPDLVSQLEYDPLGNLRARHRSGTVDALWSYQHPQKPRFLSAFHGDGEVEQLGADAGGMPTSRQVDGLAAAGFVWNAQNRLHRHGAASYAYDAFDQRVRSEAADAGVVHVAGDFHYHETTGIANKVFSLGGIPIATLGSVYTAASAAESGGAAWLGRVSALASPLSALLLLAALALAQAASRRRLPGWAAAPTVASLGLALVLHPGGVFAITSSGSGPGAQGLHAESFLALVSDHLGAVRAVVNSDGIVVETRDYDPFGRSISHKGVFETPERFGGRVDDPDAELVRLGARSYAPRWGRFLSPDESFESLDSQGLNPYSYARNQPTSRVDPLGTYSIAYYWLQPLTGRWSSTLRDDLEWRAAWAAHGRAEGHFQNRVEAGRMHDDNVRIAAELRSLGLQVGEIGSSSATAVAGATAETRTEAVRELHTSASLDGVFNQVVEVLDVFVGDHQAAVSGVHANLSGLIGATGELVISLILLRPSRIFSSAFAVVQAAVPRFGLYAGPGWGYDQTTDATPFDNAIDRSARLHDIAYAHQTDLTQADLALIRGVWSDHRLGPFGQVYRIGLTILFAGKIALREAGAGLP